MENSATGTQPKLVSKEDFCGFCHILYERHLVSGVGGNIAARSGGKIFLTPTGYSLRNIETDTVIAVFPGGEMTGKNAPTKDADMHLRIMGARPEINISLHLHGAHIISASALLSPGNDSLPPLTPGFIYYAYPLTMLPFMVPGTEPLAAAVENVFKDRSAKALLLQNHGLITIGKTFEEALNIAEEIDEACKIFVFTGGTAKKIPKKDLDSLKPMSR